MFNIFIVIGFLGVLVVLNVLVLKRIKERSGTDEKDALLHQRFDNVTKLILDELKENRQSVQKSSLAVHEQVQHFTRGLTQLEENVKVVHESLKDVASFQNIFKSPKLRGQWGETSLEAALAGYFPKERYSIQHYFRSGEAVDAALFLPNNLILPIDSKFNWENFEKMTNAKDEATEDNFRKQFVLNVKKKIDEISSKYIMPSEGTVDMALMYIPAEAVYYEIVHNIKEVDIAEYARRRKIVLVSPNTFYLTLSAIQHWSRDVQITRQTQGIIRRLARIKLDSEKLNNSFRKLGKHISDTRSAYDDSEKRLTLLTDRVERVVEVGEEDKEDKKDTIENEIKEKIEIS